VPAIPKRERRQDEAQLAADIKLLVNEQPDFMIWRNAVVPAGLYRRVDPRTGELGPPVFLRAGEPGSPDYMGFQAMGATYRGRSIKLGRFFGLEIKVPGKEPDPRQEEWAERARRYGAFSGWSDSIEATTAALERARKGEDR
jgi:hypothetical protein